jgi:hypothetical protein
MVVLEGCAGLDLNNSIYVLTDDLMFWLWDTENSGKVMMHMNVKSNSAF